MGAAQSVALADDDFMALADPTTTLSGRICYNRIVADACYVQSLMAAAVGSYKEAAQHAKQCVNLNRRIWAALESRARVPKASVNATSDHNVSGNSSFDPLSSMRSDKGIPLVMSVTHDALSGPEFWSLVPALYRGLMQHSQIFAHLGLLQEAIYVAEQAAKIASSANSPTLMVDNASWQADCWAQSGRNDKADTILASLTEKPFRKCLSVVGFHSAVARVHHCKGQYTEEVACYERMEMLLNELATPLFISSLEKNIPSVDALAKQMDSISLDTSSKQQAKSSVAGRRQPAVKSATRAGSRVAATSRTRPKVAVTAAVVSKDRKKPASSTLSEAPSVANQCHILSALQGSILDRSVLANILHDDLAAAMILLGRADELEGCGGREISHIWATFKATFARSAKQIAEDFTVNTLPESTIAFPAIGFTERRISEPAIIKRAVPAPAAKARGVRAKKQTKDNFLTTLCEARERLVEAHGLCAANGSNHLFQQISMALGHVTVLLSAVSVVELRGSLHPLYAAYMSGQCEEQFPP